MRLIAIFFVLFQVTAIAQTMPIKHDADAPVEITADTLEVFQEKKVAVFSGNVEAVQKKLSIKADTMTVHYRKNSGEQQQDAVSKIEAKGNVFLSSTKETVQGNLAIYNVQEETVLLTGSVILTSGKSVVKGEKLVYNLSTGRSKMVGNSVPSNDFGGEKKERVRGVFVPQK